MSQLAVSLDRVKKIDLLIQNKKTGTPSQLAEHLHISERNIYHYLNFIKAYFNAPIEWSDKINSYVYTRKGKIVIKWDL